jgi:hypothetical protein
MKRGTVVGSSGRFVLSDGIVEAAAPTRGSLAGGLRQDPIGDGRSDTIRPTPGPTRSFFCKDSPRPFRAR